MKIKSGKAFSKIKKDHKKWIMSLTPDELLEYVGYYKIEKRGKT